MGDETIAVSTENNILKNKVGDSDEKCLGETNVKQINTDDEKRGNLLIGILKKHWAKSLVLTDWMFINLEDMKVIILTMK